MKSLRLVLVAWILMLGVAPAQTVRLPNRWRLSPSDKAVYARPDFDDRRWAQVWVPASWHSEGFEKYHGIAWYRVHFDVDMATAQHALTLELGKIIDADQTFLNGQRIGSSGQFPPHAVTAWDVVRLYRIPAGLLKRHGNVLAVRVNDMGGSGGIDTGPIGLAPEDDVQRQFHPPLGPRHTLHQLTTTNGLVAAVYDAETDSIREFLPHIFQSYDQDKPVRPVLQHLQPTTAPNRPVAVRYLQNSHVVEVDYGLVQVHYFAPFTTAEKVLYAEVSGPRSRVVGWSFAWDKVSGTVRTAERTFPRPDGGVDRYFIFGFTDAHHHDALVAQSAARRLTPHRLQDELQFMAQVRARCHFPAGVTADERQALEQSVSVLKMAQVGPTEIFPHARGQILASLPPGVWNIAWVRDGYYSTMALSRLGLFDEARRMLDFELQADSGHYETFKDAKGREVGVGAPYRISVCRYFGPGKEESDGGLDPNIELDSFGMFLEAFSDYVERSHDHAFYARWLPVVESQVADAALHCIDANGLVRAESGPWERHLREKHFAWTSAVTAAGLRDFARLETEEGGIFPRVEQAANASRYAEAAQKLQEAIRAQLITPGGWIKGNSEAGADEAYDTHDGGTFEVFALQVLQDPTLFHTHQAEYDRVLGLRTHGYSRINKGDLYESPEWILMDLRDASARFFNGDVQGAQVLLDWVTGQAHLNYNLIPEMYTTDTWAYDGSIPMVGFGAAAYVLTVSDLHP